MKMQLFTNKATPFKLDLRLTMYIQLNEHLKTIPLSISTFNFLKVAKSSCSDVVKEQCCL